MHLLTGIIIFFTSVAVNFYAAMVTTPVSPWVDARLAQSFIVNFLYSLKRHVAFSDAELADISDVALILVPEVNKIVSKGIVSENKFRRLNILFASSIANIIANEIDRTNRETKIIATERSLVYAFLETTGLIDEVFVKEIKKLITLFSKEKRKTKQMEVQKTWTANTSSEQKNAEINMANTPPLYENQKSLGSENYQVEESNQDPKSDISNFFQSDSLIPRNYEFTNAAQNLPFNRELHINEINIERVSETGIKLAKPISLLQTESNALKNEGQNEHDFPNVISERENEILSSQKEFLLNSDFNVAKQMPFSNENILDRKRLIDQADDSKNYDSFVGQDINSDGIRFKTFVENEKDNSGQNEAYNSNNQFHFASKKSEILNDIAEQNTIVMHGLSSPHQNVQFDSKPEINDVKSNKEFDWNQGFKEQLLETNFDKDFSQEILKFDLNPNLTEHSLKLDLNYDYATDNLEGDFNHKSGKEEFDPDLNRVVSTQNNFNQDFFEQNLDKHVYSPYIFQGPIQLVPDDLNTQKQLEISTLSANLHPMNQQVIATELYSTNDVPMDVLNKNGHMMPPVSLYSTQQTFETTMLPNTYEAAYLPYMDLPNNSIDRENSIYVDNVENGSNEYSAKNSFTGNEVDNNLQPTLFEAQQQLPASNLNTYAAIPSQELFMQNLQLSSPVNFVQEQKVDYNPAFDNQVIPVLPWMHSQKEMFNTSSAANNFKLFPTAFVDPTQSTSLRLAENQKFDQNEDIFKAPNFGTAAFVSNNISSGSTQTDNVRQYFNNQRDNDWDLSPNFQTNAIASKAGTFFQDNSSHVNSTPNFVPIHSIQEENTQTRNTNKPFLNQSGNEEWNNPHNIQITTGTSSTATFLLANASYNNAEQTIAPQSGTRENEFQHSEIKNFENLGANSENTIQDIINRKEYIKNETDSVIPSISNSERTQSYVTNKQQMKQISNQNVVKAENSVPENEKSKSKNVFDKGQHSLEKTQFLEKQNRKASLDNTTVKAKSSIQNNGRNIGSEMHKDENHEFSDVLPDTELFSTGINSIHQPQAPDISGSAQTENSSLDAKNYFEKEIDVIAGQIKELLLTKSDIILKKQTQNLISAATNLKSDNDDATLATIINKLVRKNSFNAQEIPNALSVAYTSVKNRNMSHEKSVLLLETLVEFSASLVHLLKHSTIGTIDFHDAVSTDNLVRDSILKALW